MSLPLIFIRKVSLLLVLLCIQSLSAQLPLLSNQGIDFSSAVTTVADGNWSDPSIWSNGEVPNANTDVIITNGHTVYIDMQGEATDDIIDLCKNIKVEEEAVLQMGHTTPNFSKDLRINGSILCNGTFSAGRNISFNTGGGDGLIYPFNSRIFLNLTSDVTYISGSGFFNPRVLNIPNTNQERELIIDIYNMIIDDNFAIRSNNRINATIEKYAYVKVNQVLGLTGSTFQFSSPTAKSSLNIKGIMVVNDISLFTKNTTAGDFSSITIEDQGSLYVQRINNNQDRITEAAGFNFTIQSGGIFRLGKNADWSSLRSGNPNFNFTNSGNFVQHYSNTIPSNSQITSIINQFDPNQGVDVSQIQHIFGSSHIAGWYNFTDDPYLIEGLDKYKEFGSTAFKTTLTSQIGRMESAYPFNHNWPNFSDLKSVAQDRFIDSLFQRPHIKTHTFWTTTRNQGFYKQGPDFNHENFLDQEEQFYDLTYYLLDTYGEMDKTFVYQNWEGDWMLRGEGNNWENNPSIIPDDVVWMIEGMSRMFRARQRGVERARNEFNDKNATVLHGIEFNKLWMLRNGERITMMDNNTPSVLADVIPSTRIDLSSWSAYDGVWSNASNPEGHAMWKGLEMAKYFTNDTGMLPNNTPVQIGELGINENPPYNNGVTESEIRSRYGRYIGVALGLDIPNFYLWNLYGSGQQGGPQGFEWEKDVQYETDFLYEWLDGKWLIEPDESWGSAATFLMEQWENTLSVVDNSIYTKDDIILFPNPTSDYFELKHVEDPTIITLFDARGKLLKTIHYQPGMKIDINDLSKGVYFLNFKNSKLLNKTQKLLVN